MLAPTPNNKQDFLIHLNNQEVSDEMAEGTFSFIHLGIVKYHFESGTLRE